MSKTTSITVNRNYRVSNDDQYARTTLVHNIDLIDGETKEAETLRAIKELDAIFRIAYPYMEEHLNFYVVRQVNGKPEMKFHNVPIDENKFGVFMPTETEPPEKKGTIEDQIQACTTIMELETFKFVAPMNPKLKEKYESKLIELTV